MAEYSGNDEDLLAPIQGDSDAEAWRKADPLGSSIFGWGNSAWNKEIQNRQNEIARRKGSIDQELLQNARETSGLNESDWDALQKSIFGENGQKLSDTYSGLEGKDQGALDDLLAGLSDYKNSADFFNNPNFMSDVGDVANHVAPSAATVGAQKSALQQLGSLTSPTESAQEKLIRLMAQRQQEQNERGDREAMAQRLKSRGVYGSGAELVSALMSQDANSRNRELANAQANAGASQRALAALGSYGQLAGTMRAQEANEGSLANQVAEFNNAQNQAGSNLRAQQQIAATQAGENAKQSRAQSGFGATTSVNNAQRGDIQNQNQTGMALTGGRTGARTADTQLLDTALGNQKDSLNQLGAQLASQKRSSLLGGIFF